MNDGVFVEKFKIRLANELSERRFIHSEKVMEVAVHLAKIYGADTQKAALAGLLHDYMREKSGKELLEYCKHYRISPSGMEKRMPLLLHGPVAAKALKDNFGIVDTEIENAIYWHTTGCRKMALLSKIVFVADTIEPSRNFPEVHQMRQLAETDLDMAVLFILEHQIDFVLSKKRLLHMETIFARDSLKVEIQNKKNKNC